MNDPNGIADAAIARAERAIERMKIAAAWIGVAAAAALVWFTLPRW